MGLNVHSIIIMATGRSVTATMDTDANRMRVRTYPRRHITLVWVFLVRAAKDWHVEKNDRETTNIIVAPVISAACDVRTVVAIYHRIYDKQFAVRVCDTSLYNIMGDRTRKIIPRNQMYVCHTTRTSTQI